MTKTVTVDEAKLRRLVVQMVGAASAYKQFAKGDALKGARVKDFERAAAIGKALLSARAATK